MRISRESSWAAGVRMHGNSREASLWNIAPIILMYGNKQSQALIKNAIIA